MSKYLDSGAIFEPGHRFRYALWRQWSEAGGTCIVIGLNPSTADATQDDPTIRRCVGFAEREGCGKLVMLNLFGLRATDPKALYISECELPFHEVVGPGNDAVISMELGAPDVRLVIAAWGAHGRLRARDIQVRLTAHRLGRPLHCFGMTAKGQPRHPLYLRRDTALVAFPIHNPQRTCNPNEEAPSMDVNEAPQPANDDVK